MRMASIAATALLGVALLALADEKIASGLPEGASTPAYQLVNVAGPFAGKTLCVR